MAYDRGESQVGAAPTVPSTAFNAIPLLVQAGAPTDPGWNGQVSIRTSNYDLYQSNGTAFSVVGNVKGAAGAAGSNGTNGTNGADGHRLFWGTVADPSADENVAAATLVSGDVYLYLQATTATASRWDGDSWVEMFTFTGVVAA